MAQLSNQVLILDLANRRYEGTTYYAEIWVIIMHDKEWPVCDATIWMEFNLNTLNATSFHGAALFDFDPELSNAGYTANQYFYGGIRQALSIDIAAPVNGYVTKRGGSNGMSFRLGTVRWFASAGGGGMDDLMLVDDDALKDTKIYFHTPNNRCEEYDGEQGRGNVLPGAQESLYINPVGCTASFFNRRTWCRDELRELDTDDPLTVISPHWPAVPGPGGPVHQARYQYNFSSVSLPSDPLFIRGFNANDIEAIMDRVRCRWEAQIDQLSPPVTNNFEWVQTTVGGRFYFTRNPLFFHPLGDLVAYRMFAQTKTAFDSTNHWQIRDTCSCGIADTWSNRSEMVFNNTAALHEFKPHLRWTTDTLICGGGPDCIDFYAIALHEAGHYLGLAHQHYNHGLIMTVAKVWPKQNQMTQCDADNVRWLYNPSRINVPIDNSYDCNRFTNVQEQGAAAEHFRIVGEPDDYSAIYTVASAGSVELDIYNAIGQKIAAVFHSSQPVGEYILRLPTQALAVGVYFVRIKTDTDNQT